MSWKRPLASGRTRTGCTTPLAVIDAASSAKLLLVHVRARLEGIAVDLLDGNLARPSALGFGRAGAAAAWDARQQ